MEPTFIGFGPTKAYAVIFWKKNDDIFAKTVCYSEQDVSEMFGKFVTHGSLYNDFDGYEITYLKNSKVAAS